MAGDQRFGALVALAAQPPTEEVCHWYFCFVPPEPRPDPPIFGFPELLTALALLWVVYTVTDVRYKFRIAVTPGALFPVTYFTFIAIAAGSLLSSVWVTEGWWVPRTVLLSHAVLQGMFGALLLVCVFVWIHYSVIRPPVFGRRNAAQYAQALFPRILKGSDQELAVLADEVGRSAESLVRLCRGRQEIPGRPDAPAPRKPRKAGPADYAHDTLLLLGNRKFCRRVVRSAPGTAAVFFREMSRQSRYDLPLGQFAIAVSSEAISYKDSILYHEDEGFTSGLLGYLKPWSTAVYGDYLVVEGLGNRVGSPLDVRFDTWRAWDAENWAVFGRVTLITFAAYLKTQRHRQHSFSLARAFGDIEHSIFDFHGVDVSAPGWFGSDQCKRLRAVVKFTTDAIEVLEKPDQARVDRSPHEKHRMGDIHGKIADLMLAAITAASSVRGTPAACWAVHYGMVWDDLQGHGERTNARKTIEFKLRRLLYDAVLEVEKFHNHRSAAILGLLLNVLDLQAGDRRHYRNRAHLAFGNAIRAWTKRNFLKIWNERRRLAEAILVGSITFDEKNKRLVKTFASWHDEEPTKHYLELDDPEVECASRRDTDRP